ncbi:MAG TPA: hypothetical protein VJM12_16165, partial [Pyrinomonadaceae bacterium]|nr:hypothetical protein [Pyrinomonadaceae bacterium]
MLDLQPASFEAFENEARHGNVVPVVRSVLGDLQTPVGAFMRIAGSSPYAFLLESVEGGERIARYSFLGADPEMIVRGSGPRTFVDRNGKTEIYEVVATDWVRDYFRERVLAMRPGLAPFAGGAVGYLGYDAAAWFEPVLKTAPTEDPTNTQPLKLPTDAVW